MALVTGRSSVSGSFTGTGRSDHLLMQGHCSMRLDFGTGTVTLDVSDDGSTWITSKMPDGTTAASFTADVDLNLFFATPKYVSCNCSAYTSTITYRLQQA